MDEATKTKAIWGDLEKSVIQGRGIDIGCGPDPVAPDVRRFDVSDGDANCITQHVHDEFDYVYSSHCLEHMHDPKAAIQEWWKLVRPGGHLIFAVPDEDLYEQGVFPSRFNPDHKATFTISKGQSWSPVSHNVLDLARALPHSELVSIVLHDHHYDRSLYTYGERSQAWWFPRLVIRLYRGLKRRGLKQVKWLDAYTARYQAIDQTMRPDVLAQIQCIVRKKSDRE